MRVHRVGLVAVAAALGAAGCVSATRSASGDTSAAMADRGALAAAVIHEWSDVSAGAARVMLERYGPPDEVRPSLVAWNGVGPWKRVAVREVRPPLEGAEDLGVLEQTISCALTPREAAAVLLLDARLSYNPREQELSAVADREELNFLRLNLARDVAAGRADVAQARASYARIVSLEQSGKTSPYLTGLLFR